jgi:hypothetical protein
MVWIDGKPWIVEKRHLQLHWGNRGKLRCRLCDHLFIEGETVRFIFANFKDSPSKYGNFFVCIRCDTGDDKSVLEKAAEQERNAAGLLRRYR